MTFLFQSELIALRDENEKLKISLECQKKHFINPFKESTNSSAESGKSKENILTQPTMHVRTSRIGVKDVEREVPAIGEKPKHRKV